MRNPRKLKVSKAKAGRIYIMLDNNAYVLMFKAVKKLKMESGKSQKVVSSKTCHATFAYF